MSVHLNMGRYCVVAGCRYSHKDGVSLFRFPTDKKKIKKAMDKTN